LYCFKIESRSFAIFAELLLYYTSVSFSPLCFALILFMIFSFQFSLHLFSSSQWLVLQNVTDVSQYSLFNKFFDNLVFIWTVAWCVYSWGWRLLWWVSWTRIPEHVETASKSDGRAWVQNHGASQRTHVCNLLISNLSIDDARINIWWLCTLYS